MQLSSTDWIGLHRNLASAWQLAFSTMLLRQYAFLYLAGLEDERWTTCRSSVAHVERREELRIDRIIDYIHYEFTQTCSSCLNDLQCV